MPKVKHCKAKTAKSNVNNCPLSLKNNRIGSVKNTTNNKNKSVIKKRIPELRNNFDKIAFLK